MSGAQSLGMSPGLSQIDTDLQQIARALERLTVATGAIPALVTIPEGGTGATTAAGARTNLGIGTLGTQNANAADITGGTVDGTAIGQTNAFPVTATTLINTGEQADQSYHYQVPLTGFAITVPNTCSLLILNPAGTLATGTVLMPINPIDGQLVAIASSQTVSVLTVSPNGGQTLNGAPSTIAANTSLWWRYILTVTTWFRLS